MRQIFRSNSAPLAQTRRVFATLALAAALTPACALAANQNSGFYVDPDSNPAVWVRNHPADTRANAIRNSIATRPMAHWFGNWSGNIGTAVTVFVDAARAADKLPILVATTFPGAIAAVIPAAARAVRRPIAPGYRVSPRASATAARWW
ncbi:hypothetical protein [Lysobacter capsici]|uniref:hypothetical protein n=1 Tax=Lysobacter capsici TaxID=435897 RepID=UPI00398CAE35